MKKIIIGILLGWGILAACMGMIMLLIYISQTPTLIYLVYISILLCASGRLGILICEKDVKPKEN